MRNLARLTAALALVISVTPAGAQCGLLPWEGYRGTRHSFPYILRVSAPPGELLMFGVRHTRDPHDSQLAQIEQLWREFLPTVAFSEGGVRPPASSRDEAVRRFGEPGLLRSLADRDRVPLRTLEPERDKEVAALASQFKSGQAKLFYLLRDLSGHPPEAWSPDSLKEAHALAADLLPEFNTSRAIATEWFDPTRNDTFLNEVARSSTDYRNCHMVPLLVQSVRSGKRVFVVVGGSHVVVQEPALRSALRSR